MLVVALVWVIAVCKWVVPMANRPATNAGPYVKCPLLAETSHWPMSAYDRGCVKTRVRFDFARFQGSSDHYPTRKNRIQRILRGRFFSMPIFFAFSHSLDPKQTFPPVVNSGTYFEP
jgi:hypothetical protein